MQKTKTLLAQSAFFLLLTAYTVAGAVELSSEQTVDGLLAAENKAVMEKEAGPRDTLSRKAQQFLVSAIYGNGYSLRVDLTYGDRVFRGVSLGASVSGYVVQDIQDKCVVLSKKGGKPLKTCWTLPPRPPVVDSTAVQSASTSQARFPTGPLPPQSAQPAITPLAAPSSPAATPSPMAPVRDTP